MIRWQRLGDLHRLGVAHGLNAAADAFFTVSLADSLFFNVSVEAARPRLLLYLAITMAPFAVLAPLIGPFIDRMRGGQRTVLVGTSVGRAALTLALAQDLKRLLMFPEAFGVLVLGKAYSVGRNATVPRLVEDESELVAVNARLARVGLIAGSAGAAAAVGVLTSVDASAVLYTATVLFLGGALAAATVHSPRSVPPRPTRLEYQELHAARLTYAVQAMGLLRGAVGMLTFLLGFALKRSGAPVWQFGAVLAAGGIGAVAATLLSGQLRRHFTEERILVLMLAVPAGVAAVGVLHFSIVTALTTSAAVGMAASAGKHGFDAIVQRNAPDANMARAFAGFESRFQLYWIAGATIAVLAQPGPRVGLLLICVVLAGAAVVVDVALHTSEKFESPPNLVAAVTKLVLEDAPGHSPPVAVLDAAEGLLRGGSPRAAVIVAAAALEAHFAVSPRRGVAAPEALASTRAEVTEMRDAVVDGLVIGQRDAEHLIEAVRDVLDAGQRSR